MTSLRRTPQAHTGDAVEWLLDGDASVRWQTLRDLAGAPEATVSREQGKVEKEG